MRAFAFALLALTALTPPVAAQDFLAFRSPTGNIHCLISVAPFAEARCDLLEAQVNFRRPAGCDLDYGRAFGVGRGGDAAPLCVGDTVVDWRAPVLNYGGSISHAGFTCRSERSGITCTNDQGHGFKVARGVQQVF